MIYEAKKESRARYWILILVGKKEQRVFRMIALTEGISFLTLLFIAMPMKYFMGMPEVVRVVGTIHGVLFLLYVGLLAMLHFRQRWSFIFSLYALIASVIPFGTFMLDKYLREKEVVAN